jgi:hypothetical protein
VKKFAVQRMKNPNGDTGLETEPRPAVPVNSRLESCVVEMTAPLNAMPPHPGLLPQGGEGARSLNAKS